MVPYWKCSHTLGPRSASWVHLKLIKRTCQGAHDCVWIYTNYFRICQASAFGGVPGWDSKVTSIEENSTHINILVVGICQFQQRAWCCSEQRQTDRQTGQLQHQDLKRSHPGSRAGDFTCSSLGRLWLQGIVIPVWKLISLHSEKVVCGWGGNRGDMRL